jgi:acetoin utilization protein AcuB
MDKVRDYMSDGVVTANLEDGLRQTFLRMRERGIRHMPVVDGHEKVVGIVSDRDLRRPDTVDVGPDHVDAFRLDDTMHVKQVMTGCPDAVGPDSTLGDALGLFIDHGYGALPVVDASGRAVGMLSAYDVLRAARDAGAFRA